MAAGPVRDTDAMIAGMAPVLDREVYHFAIVTDPVRAGEAAALALAAFSEDEGLSVILADGPARDMGLSGDLPMRRITLTVHSALDGVGLTAAVATALAQAGIACNMVAAYHHDHAFVPAGDAGRAMDLLKQLAGQAPGAAP